MAPSVMGLVRSSLRGCCDSLAVTTAAAGGTLRPPVGPNSDERIRSMENFRGGVDPAAGAAGWAAGCWCCCGADAPSAVTLRRRSEEAGEPGRPGLGARCFSKSSAMGARIQTRRCTYSSRARPPLWPTSRPRVPRPPPATPTTRRPAHREHVAFSLSLPFLSFFLRITCLSAPSLQLAFSPCKLFPKHARAPGQCRDIDGPAHCSRSLAHSGGGLRLLAGGLDGERCALSAAP